MYAWLRSAGVGGVASLLICITVQAAAIVLVVLLSDTPFGVFSYFRR